MSLLVTMMMHLGFITEDEFAREGEKLKQEAGEMVKMGVEEEDLEKRLRTMPY